MNNKQPFESHPELANILLWFANNVGVPGAQWSELIRQINKAVVAPSPVSGSLEEAAHTWANKNGFSASDEDDDEGHASHKWAVDAFLAGAAYRKGDDEGLTKEQIAQICEMADNDYAAQEAIMFAEWIRDEQYTQSLRNLDKWYRVPAKERTEYFSTKNLYELFKTQQK